jgi:hypothetical protein
VPIRDAPLHAIGEAAKHLSGVKSGAPAKAD